MAENTKISWADHTMNPWIGCTKISPACDGCYAEFLMQDRMKRVIWGGPGKGDGTRDRTSEENWRKPLAWNRKAGSSDVPVFVFCSSLADVFDNAVPPEWRRDLFDLIRATPNLTWLLLTKRPGNIVKLWEQARGGWEDSDGEQPLYPAWPRNAAIGCTVVTQEEADRDVPKLLAAKAALNPAFAFLSMEPLLGPVDLTGHLYGRAQPCAECPMDADCGCGFYPRGACDGEAALDWIITGGETDQGKHEARPADPAWFRSLRDQCAAAGVPFHFKQWGEWQPVTSGPVGTRDECFFTPAPDGSREVRTVRRIGKHRDPGTLDGVTHDARPSRDTQHP